MPGEGLGNGVAPLRADGKVDSTHLDSMENLNSTMGVGNAAVGDGAGGLIDVVMPGSYYSQVENNTTDSTSGGTFINYLTLDTNVIGGDVPAGNYKISWSYMWATDGTGNTVNIIATLTAPGVGPNVFLNSPPPQVINEARYEPQDADNRHTVSGWRIVPLNAGRQYIEINFAQGDGAGTVLIHRGAIILERVP